MSRLSFFRPGSPWHGHEISSAAPPPALAGEPGIFGVFTDAVRPILDHALACHREPNALPNRLTLLVDPAPLPLDDRRRDPPVLSFLTSGELMRDIPLSSPPVTWCFELLRRALAVPRTDVDMQIVHRAVQTIVPVTEGPAEAVCSHRGPERYVRLCVDSLLRQSHPVAITIGIDQKYGCDRLRADVADRPSVRLYRIDPHPVGPFVALHVFSTRSRADYIVRQDCDDYALPQRVATLIAACRETGAGMVGSHEVQLDEIAREVVPVRYPADVSQAVRRAGAQHQILLPTTVCTRETFEVTGGFSTVRLFGHDVDHWLRASLHAQLRTVDEFLYIRRRHPRSLTMRPDIGNFSPVRQAIRERRRTDLAAILAGERPLAATSLALAHRAGPITVTDLQSSRVEVVELSRTVMPLRPAGWRGHEAQTS